MRNPQRMKLGVRGQALVQLGQGLPRALFGPCSITPPRPAALALGTCWLLGPAGSRPGGLGIGPAVGVTVWGPAG